MISSQDCFHHEASVPGTAPFLRKAVLPHLMISVRMKPGEMRVTSTPNGFISIFMQLERASRAALEDA